MNLLLDTAAFLWLCAGGKRLSAAAKTALANPANNVYLSAVTAWEIGLKQAKGKLELPAPARAWFPAMVDHHRLSVLALEAGTAIAATQLPGLHADPFDRVLVATALERDLTMLTPDPLIAKYPNVKTLW